jgi:hypothetical protein
MNRPLNLEVICMEMKGQASAEFLMILAVAVVIITAILIMAAEQVEGLGSLKDHHDARNTVLDLSAAAKDVHSQGAGARKDVYVVIPGSYDPFSSYINSSAIVLSARGTDYAAEERFSVYGSFPNSYGPHWVTVSCEGDSVRIGKHLAKLNRNSIYTIMKRNSTRRESVALENQADTNISVDMDITWSNPHVGMAVSSGSFSLDTGESQTIDIDFDANGNATGYYNGEILFQVTDGTDNMTIGLPITVKVIAVANSPPLTVIPGLWNESIQPGQTRMKTFTVCTNEQTILTGVDFQPSPGSPGDWIGLTSSLGSMARGSCREKILSATVDVGAEPGLYTGLIQVEGQGDDEARDTISLEFLVGGDLNDSIGPQVSQIIQIPSRVSVGDKVRFVVTGSDHYRGNNTIKGCDFKADGGNWTPMDALDGTFNNMIEKARAEHSGFSTMGVHNLSFRCTDSQDNVGPEANHTVKVMKSFLFITKQATSDWMDWVDNQSSELGFSWQYDRVDESDVATGVIDTSYYAGILMDDYQKTSGIDVALFNYTSSGGVVVLLGDSLAQGPKHLGHSGSPGTLINSDTAYIKSNAHYATQDYSDGETVTLFNASGLSGGVKNYIGTKYAAEDSSETKTILGEYAGVIVWGPKVPLSFIADGDSITTKLMDYILLESTITPW